MFGVVHPSRLQVALKLLPPRLLAALDAWSLRLARKRLEKRRAALK